MTERVDVANMALSWLGEQSITSLDDDLDRARKMKTNYIHARDATLEAHDWTFAMRRFIPGKNAEGPTYGAGNLFDIPSDILRVVAVDPDDVSSITPFTAPINSHEQLDWVLEGRQILCNEDVIYCRGVRRVEEEGLFSPLFVHAFAAKLAMLTAISLTASAEIQGNMFALYERLIQEAASRDGLQGRSRRIRSRSLRKVR